MSYFHHHNIFPGYYFKGNFEDFSKFFMNGVLQYGNYWTILKVNILTMYVLTTTLIHTEQNMELKMSSKSY